MSTLEVEQPVAEWPVYPPEDTNASEFDWQEYLGLFPVAGLEFGSGRRNLTRFNPLLFALIYFRHHLADESGVISFSDFHLESCRVALNWARPITKKRQYRDCIVGPRSVGKSTWWFLILPMWAAAHGHVKFLAAFSDSATQAERHLDNFRKELENNALLRRDFRELSDPAKRRGTQYKVAVNSQMLQTASGFVFTANGIDSSTLGLKIENKRPDLLVLDDIEPGESSYSLNQAAKRLSTIQDVVFPLNDNARVVIAGTVTMEGSIIHQLVKTITEPDEPHPSWIDDENIKVRYAPPIITDLVQVPVPTTTVAGPPLEETPGQTEVSHTKTETRTMAVERSLWPYKWPLSYLKSIEHTRSFAKNFANRPVGADGLYWTEKSFTIDPEPGPFVLTYLSIDPAVTSTGKSDYTALSVVSYVPSSTDKKAHLANLAATKPGTLVGMAAVRHAEHVRLAPGPQLRDHVIMLLEQFPETRKVIVETNQGGEAWAAILHDLPVKIEAVHQSVNKEVRASHLFNEYEVGRVVHTRHFMEAEQEMMSFPLGTHDDIVDSISTAVHVIREQEQAMRKTLAPQRVNRQVPYTR